MNDCIKCKYMPYTVCDFYPIHGKPPTLINPEECTGYVAKNLWQRFIYWWRHK